MFGKAILHPLFFAAYPVLFLYAHNHGVFNNPAAYATPLLLCLALAGAVFLLLWALLRKAHKAAVLTTLFLFLFFSFDMLYFKRADLGLFSVTFKEHDFALLLGIVFVVAVFLAWRAKGWDFSKATSLLNATGLVLLAMPLATLAVGMATGSGQNKAPDKGPVQAVSVGEHMGEPVENPRDIYYIILDGYAHEQTLKDVYGFDNSEFYDELAKRGFYVASESLCNYPRTRLSLPSSLNMEYLPETFAMDGPIEPMTAFRYLQSRGYRFLNFNSGWEGTTDLPFADGNFTYNEFIPNNEVMTLLLGMTPLRSVVVGQGFARGQVLYVFDNLPAMVGNFHQNKPGPVAVMAHVIAPHPPFVFTRDGGNPDQSVLSFDGRVWDLKEPYVEQILFVNSRVLELVDQIKAQSDQDPIIVLQADHGSMNTRSDPANDGKDWDGLIPKTLQERYRIFNAYHFPDRDPAEVLYPSITPVNTFRVILDTYFDEHLELLPDKSYAPPGEDGHFRFVDITDVVDFH